MQPLAEVVALSERVLARLRRIMNGEDMFCAYCGKDGGITVRCVSKGTIL